MSYNSTAQDSNIEAFPTVKIEIGGSGDYPTYSCIDILSRGDSIIAKTFFWYRSSQSINLDKDSIVTKLSSNQLFILEQYLNKARTEGTYFTQVGLYNAPTDSPYCQTTLWKSASVSYTELNQLGLEESLSTITLDRVILVFRETERMGRITFEHLDSSLFEREYKILEQVKLAVEDSVNNKIQGDWQITKIRGKLNEGDTLILRKGENLRRGSRWAFGEDKRFDANKNSKLDLHYSNRYNINGDSKPAELIIQAGNKIGRTGSSEVGNFGKSFGVIKLTDKEMVLVLWDRIR